MLRKIGLVLIVLAVLPMLVTALEIEMLDNTDTCVYKPHLKKDFCYTVYNLCVINGSFSDKEVSFLFRDDNTKLSKSKPSMKEVMDDVSIKDNALGSTPSKDCKIINITALKDPYANIDNIPCYGNMCWPEYAWWNSSYLKRTCWTITNPHGIDLINVSIKIDVDAKALEPSNGCNDFDWGNTSGILNYWNFTPCHLNGSESSWIIKMPDISTNNNTKVCVYYNNSGDSTFDSNITLAGIFGDNFDDNDISDWQNGVRDVDGSPTSDVSITNRYVYNNAETAGVGMSKSFDNTTFDAFRVYASGYVTDSGFVGLGISPEFDHGYLLNTIRAALTDTEILFTPASVAVAESNTAWNKLQWYNIEWARNRKGYWSEWRDKLPINLDVSNTSNLSYNYFDNATIILRKDQDRLDFILITKWCDDCTTTADSEEKFGMTISIQRPENTTHQGSDDIPLVWHFFPGETGTTCDTSMYSLNGASNISTACANVSRIDNIVVGSNNVTMFVNDSNSSQASATVFFTVSFANYTINILDEITLLPFNASSMTATAICVNRTETIPITASTQQVEINCTLTELKLEIEDVNNNTHWRTLIPTTVNGTVIFYMINESENTKVAQEWIIFDVTSDYLNGIVQATKIIGSTGEVSIIEKVLDAESKILAYLIVGERYCISVFTATKTNERSIGCMDADTATEKRLAISQVPFDPDQELSFQEAFVSFAWNKDAQTISALYNDTLAKTTNSTFTVYNATNISQILFTDSSTANVVTYTYNGVDTNTEYIAIITAVHEVYGDIEAQVIIDFGGKYKVPGLEAQGLGFYMSIAGAMIAMFIMLAFGKRHAKIGSAVFVIFIMLFMNWGWFESSPQVTWSLITFMAFIVFINVLSLKRRLQ